MSDEVKPARKRQIFQVHLSTAIILMFAAGGILWANCVEWTLVNHDSGILTISNAEFTLRCRGFPVPIVYRIARGPEFFSGYELNAIKWRAVHPENYIRLDHAAFDAFLAGSVLFAIWVFCERRIRHRSAPKDP